MSFNQYVKKSTLSLFSIILGIGCSFIFCCRRIVVSKYKGLKLKEEYLISRQQGKDTCEQKIDRLFYESICNLIAHNKIDCVMDDYELYFQNDAARMNEDLEQYQFFQHNQPLLDILHDPFSSDLCPTTPSPQTPPKLIPEELSTSYLTIPETLLHSNLDIVPPSSDPTSSTKNQALLSSKQPWKKKLIHKSKSKGNVKEKPEQYPTKNFLQNFKGAHMDYLKKFFPVEDLQKYDVIVRMKGKNSMSRSLYQELYSIPQFQAVFTKMFASRYLYRAMMLSRSETTAKKNHSQKILVLQQAFYSKKFLKIN